MRSKPKFKHPHQDDPTITMRPSAGGYVGFAVIFVGLAVLWAYTAVSNADPKLWIPCLFMLGVYILIAGWIRLHKIVITESDLTYWALFSKQSIMLSDVGKHKFGAFEKKYDRIGPPIRIEIKSRSTKQVEVVINAKLFGWPDLIELERWLAIAEAANKAQVVDKVS